MVFSYVYPKIVIILSVHKSKPGLFALDSPW